MSNKYTLEDLAKGLAIDKHSLDEALLRQPDLFYRVSDTLALMLSQRDEAKNNLAEVEAQVDLDVRDKAKQRDEKITEREVDARKITSPKVKEAQDDLRELNLEVARWTALKDSFIQRSYVLKDLSSLYVANYYTESATNSHNSNAIRNNAGTAAREAMARVRRERGR